MEHVFCIIGLDWDLSFPSIGVCVASRARPIVLSRTRYMASIEAIID